VSPSAAGFGSTRRQRREQLHRAGVRGSRLGGHRAVGQKNLHRAFDACLRSIEPRRQQWQRFGVAVQASGLLQRGRGAGVVATLQRRPPDWAESAREIGTEVHALWAFAHEVEQAPPGRCSRLEVSRLQARAVDELPPSSTLGGALQRALRGFRRLESRARLRADSARAADRSRCSRCRTLAAGRVLRVRLGRLAELGEHFAEQESA
jgi:hypothetical protein